jgi:hypothetical protein
MWDNPVMRVRCEGVEYANCGQFARNAAEGKDARENAGRIVEKKGSENETHGILT